MKAELEKLASEVRQIREKSMRPRYAPELIARTVKLMENYELKFQQIILQTQHK